MLDQPLHPLAPVATNPPPDDIEVVATATTGVEPSLQEWHDGLFEIERGAERVQHHAVAFAPGHTQHERSDRSYVECRWGTIERRWCEVRCHQGELVVVAFIGKPFTGLPAGKDCPNRLHVFAHTGRWRSPWHAESSLVVRLDLAAESEREATAGQRLQIPCHRGCNHWTARKRNSHIG